MKRALIVVDYQKDFIDGSLGFSGAEQLEDKIESKIIRCLDNQDDLIFTFDTHAQDYLSTKEGAKLPVVHCVKGTDGWNIYKTLQGYLPNATKIFEKNTFGSLPLANFLKSQQYDQVELAGLVSHICVLSNAVLAKAALPEADIIVDAYATAAADERIHNEALDVLEGIHITVTNR